MRDTGRSPDEVGVNGAEATLPSRAGLPQRKGPLRLTAFHMVLGAVMCVGVAFGGFLMSMQDRHQAPVAEHGADAADDIVPASGPPETGLMHNDGGTPSSIDDQDWGDAPELAPLRPATGSTD